MKQNAIQLSLQFASFIDVGAPEQDIKLHRQALPRHKVLRAVQLALQPTAIGAEIGIRIVNTAEGLELNTTYRNKTHATNVLTFNYSSAPHVHADLVLCAPVVMAESIAQNKDLHAHYLHLVVHGVLHAQGYDHETNEADAVKMEALESSILAQMGIANPYAWMWGVFALFKIKPHIHR